MMRLAWCLSGALIVASCGANHLAVGTSDDASGARDASDAGEVGPVIPPEAIAACQAYCKVNSEGCADCINPVPAMIGCLLLCQADATCCARSPDGCTITVGDCADYRCNRTMVVGGFAAQSATCQSAWVAYYDCVLAQSPLCEGGYVAQPGPCADQAHHLTDVCD